MDSINDKLFPELFIGGYANGRTYFVRYGDDDYRVVVPVDLIAANMPKPSNGKVLQVPQNLMTALYYRINATDGMLGQSCFLHSDMFVVVDRRKEIKEYVKDLVQQYAATLREYEWIKPDNGGNFRYTHLPLLKIEKPDLTLKEGWLYKCVHCSKVLFVCIATIGNATDYNHYFKNAPRIDEAIYTPYEKYKQWDLTPCCGEKMEFGQTDKDVTWMYAISSYVRSKATHIPKVNGKTPTVGYIIDDPV